jgi:hypothetical protein
VSEQKSIKAPKDHHDQDRHASLPYLTKMVRIEEHKHYKPEEDKDRMTEKEMVSQVGSMLTKQFGSENIMVQGFKKRKMN